MNWIKVFSTHCEAQELAVGPWRGLFFPGVALPSRQALYRWVMLRYKDRWTVAQVADVGPWSVDDNYWDKEARPRAEILKGQFCPITDGGHTLPTVPDGKGGNRTVSISNGAGIDIFPYVAKCLGIKIGENVHLEWRFVELPGE